MNQKQQIADADLAHTGLHFASFEVGSVSYKWQPLHEKHLAVVQMQYEAKWIVDGRLTVYVIDQNDQAERMVLDVNPFVDPMHYVWTPPAPGLFIPPKHKLWIQNVVPANFTNIWIWYQLFADAG